eukprot:TRINITY_DN2431_c0_g1_i1.p1 TRINITY_DN2431_c0_g1~~TRINITY_DN2431_c0_g1_i1.p1  ORF type:complete len:487 (+),score=125.19 TRINITY_DN2431_c0_g1_i1:53-1462(+)
MSDNHSPEDLFLSNVPTRSSKDLDTASTGSKRSSNSSQGKSGSSSHPDSGARLVPDDTIASLNNAPPMESNAPPPASFNGGGGGGGQSYTLSDIQIEDGPFIDRRFSMEEDGPLLSMDQNEEHKAWSRTFSALKKTEDEIKTLPKNQKKFYQSQNDMIDSYTQPLGEAMSEEDIAAADRKVNMALRLSLGVNVFLFIAQIVAAILANSLALIATSIDAFMDLLSGAILFMTDRARKRQNHYLYPQGKSRMEPVGIIIFAALMSTVSVQLIIEGVTALTEQKKGIALGIPSIVLVAAAIGAKVLLFIYCRTLTYSPSAMALAEDHRNDLIVNTTGLTLAILAQHLAWWLDPSGALIVAVVILRSWTMQAYQQMKLLVGKSAPPEFLRRLTYVALSHSPEVLKVDTCRAFHVGTNLFVEVDIVLPEAMPLRETHDICESLQIKLERIPEVERAFVHADYEFRHKPEHKMAK